MAALPVQESRISGAGQISRLVQLNPGNEDASVLFWCNDKNIAQLANTAHGTVIASAKIKEINVPESLSYIIVESPRKAFATVIKKFFDTSAVTPGISKTAVIAGGVTIGKDVFIGEHVIIEKGCSIGDHTVILHNTVINAGTVIGNSVRIGSNNTIGGVGFGYEKLESGEYELIAHIGNVEIGDFVEIGNNTCIDRAVMGSTQIKKNAKIDNLVHIAHGVVIEENALIIAHAMIGGSTTIGKNVWVAPGALVINKGAVGDDSLVGMGAVVIRPVEQKTVVAGNPAKFIKNI